MRYEPTNNKKAIRSILNGGYTETYKNLFTSITDIYIYIKASHITYVTNNCARACIELSKNQLTSSLLTEILLIKRGTASHQTHQNMFDSSRPR